MFDETMVTLASLSNAQIRKQNTQRGVGENQFGAKLGDLRTLAKTTPKDLALVAALWESGNFDAMLLAVLLMNPKRLSPDELETLVRGATYTQVADWLNSYVVKLHPQKEALRVKWLAESDPMLARSAWSLTAQRAAQEKTDLDLVALLDRIESELVTAPALVQWTMNYTLAQIGIHHPAFRQRALAIGERLGVYRDFPVSKGCVSPFAPIWITEMVQRQTGSPSS